MDKQMRTFRSTILLVTTVALGGLLVWLGIRDDNARQIAGGVAIVLIAGVVAALLRRIGQNRNVPPHDSP